MNMTVWKAPSEHREKSNFSQETGRRNDIHSKIIDFPGTGEPPSQKPLLSQRQHSRRDLINMIKSIFRLPCRRPYSFYCSTGNLLCFVVSWYMSLYELEALSASPHPEILVYFLFSVNLVKNPVIFIFKVILTHSLN